MVGPREVGVGRWGEGAQGGAPLGRHKGGPKDGLLRLGGPPVGGPQVVSVSQGVGPRGGFQVGDQSAVGLSRLGPKGWVSGGGPYGGGH